MWMIIVTLAVIAAGIVVFFNLPYSATRTKFAKSVTEQIKFTAPPASSASDDIFTLDDIKELPGPVRRYFEYSGYIGTPKMSYMKATFKDVDFILSPDKPPIRIDYTQYNFVREPVRLAYIDTSM